MAAFTPEPQTPPYTSEEYKLYKAPKKHRFVCHFPALNLLTVQSQLWLPYPSWAAHVDEDEAKQKLAAAEIPYAYGCYTLKVPVDESSDNEFPLRLCLPQNENLKDAMDRAETRSGVTRLELVTILGMKANSQALTRETVFDLVVYRVRRHTSFFGGDWEEEIYEYDMYQWHFQGRGSTVPNWFKRLNEQLWRETPGLFLLVKSRLAKVFFNEFPIKWGRLMDAETYLELQTQPVGLDILQASERNCEACHSAFDTGHSNPRMLACGHVYSKECFLRWTQEEARSTCCMCRAELPIIRVAQHGESFRDWPVQGLHWNTGFAGTFTWGHARYVKKTRWINAPSVFGNYKLLCMMQNPLLNDRGWVVDRFYIEVFRLFRDMAGKYTSEQGLAFFRTDEKHLHFEDLHEWRLSEAHKQAQRDRTVNCHDNLFNTCDAGVGYCGPGVSLADQHHIHVGHHSVRMWFAERSKIGRDWEHANVKSLQGPLRPEGMSEHAILPDSTFVDEGSADIARYGVPPTLQPDHQISRWEEQRWNSSVG